MNKAKLVFSSGIAGVFEWYDYALFSHFAIIFSKEFFPSDDPNVSLLNVFAVFAVGYLMRPLGGIVFGVIGDKFGRKVALSTSVMCMALPTAMIGLLPTYQSIGIAAPVLMIIARMLQGLSMGGALTGSMSFIIEHTKPQHRGFVGSIPMASICVGILLGSIVASITEWFLSAEQFESWGWRIPFLLGIFVMYAGLYIKRHTQETPMFTAAKAYSGLVQSPLKIVFKKYWFDMIISILINSTGSVLFYLQATYLMNYLHVAKHVPQSTIHYMTSISLVIMAIVAIFSGWLSDKLGRRKIYVMLNLLIISSIFTLMDIFQNGSIDGIWFAQIIVSIFAAMYIGAEPALQAEFYPTNIRNTALSLSYNTAVSVFGGTTPYIFHLLFQKTGVITSTGYYIVICSVFSLLALFFYRNRSENNTKPKSTKEL